MRLPKRHIVRDLIPAVEELRRQALELERSYEKDVKRSHRLHQDSARNLLHYLALRQADIRGLQKELGMLGLSRLGRAEAHALPSLEAILTALHALVGRQPPVRERRRKTLSFGSSGARLAQHTQALLGMPSGKRNTRIMVTMPSEAATQPDLIRELLGAGMDVMRINCAHDDPDAWLAMIRHLRDAGRETGRGCKVYADLAGPKLRTGAIEPTGRLAGFGPRRGVRGEILEPASVWLTSREVPAEPPGPAAAVLPVDRELLAETREGDRVGIEDCRGSLRYLAVERCLETGCLALGRQRIYVEDGARCVLLRGETVIQSGRVGSLPEVILPIVLKPGDRLLLTDEGQQGHPAVCDAKGRVLRPASIPCTLDAVFDAAAPGHAVWFDDGKIGGRVVENRNRVVTVEIIHAAPKGSKLRHEKGINLPDTVLDIPALTAKDRSDLEALAPHVDMVGLSFVRTAADVLVLHEALEHRNAPQLGVVLKIETRQAFENLPMILLASLRRPPVGLMVARGDLAVEVGFDRLAELQEEILWLAEAAHVPVIWATQVLESMIKKGLPSRAEVSDAALSVRAECVMLNKGPHIVAATRFLGGILERMSAHRAKNLPMMRRLSVSNLPARNT